ncbi:MAG: GspH/FimT family pseudopilin, partial [Chromatiales bacterium]|nr:GspH/FimT family pseudopilin [Chromatiales bacterium]
MKKRHYYKGFTLVELVVTLAVASILLSVAIPSFKDIIRNNRATTYANQFIADLALARSEAIKRGLPVFMTSKGSSSGDEWGNGWRVWADTNGNDIYDSGEEIKETVQLQNEATLGSNDTLTQIGFLSSGVVDLEAFAPSAPTEWPSTFQLRFDNYHFLQLHLQIFVLHW